MNELWILWPSLERWVFNIEFDEDNASDAMYVVYDDALLVILNAPFSRTSANLNVFARSAGFGKQTTRTECDA